MKFNVHLTIARDRQEALNRLSNVECDSAGAAKMSRKMRHYSITVEGIKSPGALILKQEMLSLGGEAAIAKDALDNSVERGNVILMGTIRQLGDLTRKISPQPFGLKPLSEDLKKLIKNIETTHFSIQVGNKQLDLAEKPLVMGIVNVTPDSFYDGGKYHEREAAIKHGLELAEQGADILDVGGESTRPGSEKVSLEEELSRVIPVIQTLAEKTHLPISIDTQKAEVARRALAAGAKIVNDISALGADPEMAGVVARHEAALVLMHIQGTPQNMQQNPGYQDLWSEVIAFLSQRMDQAIAEGVDENKIILDPGIGFGKTVDHNLELIRDLFRLRSLGRPILLGSSNKSFIGKILDREEDQRTEGTAASVVAGILSGAHIIRVHDVKGMLPFVKMAAAMRAGSNIYTDTQ